jgi:dynein light chain Tctex-type 1
VEDIIESCIMKQFTDLTYEAKQAQKWANQTTEEIIKRVQDEMSQNFKFMCTLIVLTKGDSGFHMSASCFWEGKSDGNFNRKFDFEEFYVIVNFFGISRN